MTANPHSIDLSTVVSEHLERAEPDLLRSLLQTFIEALMSAEADAACGAPYGTRSAERTNSRNGYRPRTFDTRTDTMEVAIPKLRTGSYFPDWLLECRKRAERALTTVVATCYLLGVSTRRMEKLVETLGITGLSKSQVSVMAKELDQHVESFRTRPPDAGGRYTFVAADAVTMKVREGGRVVNTHALIATGVNTDGHREILGLDICSAESEAGWLTLFRGVTARGLSGVKLVTSDAHFGLVAAIGATLVGASWQRCRTHYAANLMSVTPKASWGWVKAMLHSIYDQPDAAAVHAQFDRVVDKVRNDKGVAVNPDGGSCSARQQVPEVKTVDRELPVAVVSRFGLEEAALVTAFVPGLELSRQFYHWLVRPILDARFPGLPYSAALLGRGSEVLGFDDEMSTDHDWNAGVLLVLRRRTRPATAMP